MKKHRLFLPIILMIIAAALALVACAGNGDKDKTEPEEPVFDPNVVSISLDTTNATTVFDIGGAPFDPSGVGIVLHYADGSTKLALPSLDQITAPDMTTRGTKKVTVSYDKLSASYDILVREIEDVYIDAANATKQFELNAEFSVGNLGVWAKFHDIEAGELITEDKYEVSGYDMGKRGDQTVTVSYLGIKKTYGIRVKSRPAELTSAVVSESGDRIFVTVYGKVVPDAKYGKDDFALDIQQLNTDNYTELSGIEAKVNGEGAFEVKGRASAAALKDDGAYLVHLKLGGDSYDVTSLITPADNTVKCGDGYYRLKSEKAFDNNETLFVVLRKASDIKKLASYNVSKVSLAEDDGKAYIEIAGTHGNYTAEQVQELAFYFDVQGNREAMNDGSNDGNRYIVHSHVALELGEGGKFTARFELTELGVYKYTVHFRVGEARNDDSDNVYCSGRDSYVDVGGKRYKLVFGDPVYWGSVGLEVYDASDEGAVYEIKLDCSKAQTRFFVGEEFNAEGLKLTATTFGGDTSEVEADDYTVEAPDTSAVGEKTVTVRYAGRTATYAIEVVKGSMHFHSATMVKEGDNAVITVAGYFEGVKIDDLVLEFRSKSAWNVPIAAETFVGKIGNTFTATVAVPNIIGEEMFLWARLDGIFDSELSQLNIGSVEHAKFDTENGRYTFEQKSLFDEKKLLTVLIEKECNITAATLTKEDDKVYLVLSGNAKGVGDGWKPKVDVEDTNDFNLGKNVITPDPIVSVDDAGNYTVKQELSSFELISSHHGDRFIIHFIPFGTGMDVKNLDGFTETAVEAYGRGYRLYADNVFGDGVMYICLTFS